MQIYIDGKYYDKENAKISVFDHGALYGDGVFEGIRVYGGKIFKTVEHIDRLWDSAKAIRLEIPMSKEELTKVMEETVALNEVNDGYIRLIVTRGVGDLGLDPDKCKTPSIIIIAAGIALYPPELYDKGLEIVTVSSPRIHPASLSPRIKSLNYLNNILAKIEGKQAGCIEALMLNHKGELAECTGDNIFLVRKGRLMTPPPNAGILEGITRNCVMDLAREMGAEVLEIPLTKYDAYVADECFLTGSAAEVIAVVKIDGRVIGDGKPGPMTRELKARFVKLTQS
ncbi:MAG: branched-chain-amino-acid transaminase [Pirellulales bacterium]|nr:branched-chain-amino-acid transaminase [Pirellulales bacterium]